MRKPFKALVNDNIVHQEIRKAIGHDAEANGLQPIHVSERSEENAQKAGHGKDDEECIVFFKKAGAGIVMVFVQIP